MRFAYQGVARDQGGRLIPQCLASVYLSGTMTPANVYTQGSGGAPVNSVMCNAVGAFIFFADTVTYPASQLFRIILSYFGFATNTYDYIQVYPSGGVLAEYAGTVNLTAGIYNVVFPVSEPDTLYKVTTGIYADEVCFVTNKLITGFTLNSSNGLSNAAVDYLVSR